MSDRLFPGAAHAVATTYRGGDRGLQSSPVVVTARPGDIVVFPTLSHRAKAHNLLRDPRITLCLLPPDFVGPWATIQGQASVRRPGDAPEAIAEYYRVAHGRYSTIGGATIEDAESALAQWERESRVLIEVSVTDIAAGPLSKLRTRLHPDPAKHRITRPAHDEASAAAAPPVD